MKNIVLARVDDRLIHGQILSGWALKLQINVIWIIDDALAKDKLTQRMLRAVVPRHYQFYVFSVAKAAAMLQGEALAKERILLLVKSPVYFYQLIEAGCVIPSINLGGMGMHDDRRPFFRNLSCNEDEKHVLQQMSLQGVEIYYQLVPGQKKIDMKNLLENE